MCSLDAVSPATTYLQRIIFFLASVVQRRATCALICIRFVPTTSLVHMLWTPFQRCCLLQCYRCSAACSIVDWLHQVHTKTAGISEWQW
jgi:hypothetical protein